MGVFCFSPFRFSKLFSWGMGSLDALFASSLKSFASSSSSSDASRSFLDLFTGARASFGRSASSGACEDFRASLRFKLSTSGFAMFICHRFSERMIRWAILCLICWVSL